MAEHTAHRIPQRANVCGMPNIGFNDKRITAPAQGLVRLFAHDRMAALHDQLVDLPKQLRGQQAHIVYQCLIVVAFFVPNVGMTKKLAQSHVLVRQLMQPIKVAAQALVDHTQYQNAPHRHARTSHLS